MNKIWKGKNKKDKNAETFGTVIYTHNLEDKKIPTTETNNLTSHISSLISQRAKIIVPLIVLFALICVVAIVCVVSPFGRLSDESDVLGIPTIVPNDEEILASTTTVEHVCSNYYVTKYDATNHWNECSICGQKYNVVAHTYTDTWTMGESCSTDNKCNHVCSCGYSYQTNNTREHNLSPLRSDSNAYRHNQICNTCNKIVNSEICKKEDGSEINCGNLGTCTVCGHVYSQSKHRNSTKKNGDVNCSTCGKYIGTVSNIETNYPTTNTFEWSYDFSVSSSGNLDDSRLVLGRNRCYKRILYKRKK